MAFESRPPRNSSGFSDLVDQITEAVRKKLLEAGLPVSSTPAQSAAPFQPKTTPSYRGADRIGQAADTPFRPEHAPGQVAHLSAVSSTAPTGVAPMDAEMASMIDHTLLKPEATAAEIDRVCDEAIRYHFATVCVNSSHVAHVASRLRGSTVKAIAVVGFPLGAASTSSKVFESKEAIRNGAQEIDMVIQLGALKSKEYAEVYNDILEVVRASAPFPVKVILETSNLTDEEKIIGCALSKAAGAAFVKTSTGFAAGGATAEDIALMRRIVGPEMGVKASGGIRSHEDAEKMIEAGANRIGASASVAIVTKSAPTPPKSDGSKKPFKGGVY